jgi:ATP-binding cassette, subfamily C, bacterial
MIIKKLPPEMAETFRACRTHLAVVALFSMAVNLLYLALPIYTLQVYDRVLSSSNIATLVMLTVGVLIALATLAALDAFRTRVLVRAGVRLDRLLSQRVLGAIMEASLVAPGGQRAQALRDLDTFRSFITGTGILALLDLPWALLYLAVLYMLHPLLGVAATVCGLVLLTLAVLNEYVTHKSVAEAAGAGARSYAFTEAGVRNAEIVRATGMLPDLLTRWSLDRNRMLSAHALAADRGADIAGVIKFIRLFTQCFILGLGAYLAIQHTLTPGAMIAGSILLGRAMQPIEQIVGVWKYLISAVESLERISRLLSNRPPQAPAISPPKPAGHLSVEGVVFVPPGTNRTVLNKVSFSLQPGEVLGVIGPSAAGKSTLARVLIGVYPPSSGVVRLDGANVWTWERADFGRHVGYLPQDIELFAGTVGDNIARFANVEADKVIRAATLAGAHEMILRLSNGYETEVGEQGVLLSGGQRQQIALARAVYGEPKLLVLDEPNSNLDSTGEHALLLCVNRLKELGSTIVIISHRLAALNVADKVLVLDGGAVRAFGPRQEVMSRLGPVPMPRNFAASGAAGS